MWMPVKKYGFPSSTGLYWVYAGGVVELQVWDGHFFRDETSDPEGWFGEIEYKNSVTHWQPFVPPEPPI